MEEKAPKIEEVDLEKINDPILKELMDAGVITEQGIRISGMGMLVRKIERTNELIDKTNLKLHFIEKKLEN